MKAVSITLVLLICLGALSAQHDNVIRLGIDNVSDLTPYLTVSADTTGHLRYLDYHDIEHRLSLESQDLDYDALRPEIDYLVQFSLVNPSLSNQRLNAWILELDLGLTWSKALVRRGDNVIEEHITGFFTPTSLRTFAPTVKANLHKLNINTDERVDVLLFLRSDRPSIRPKLDMSLRSSDQYYSHLNREKQLNMLYLGFVLMMLLYDKANIYYSLYLFFTAVHISYNSGDMHDFIDHYWSLGHPEFMYFGKFTAYIALMCYSQFIRYFMNMKELFPVWDKLLKYLTYGAIPFLITDTVLNVISNYSPNISDRAIIPYALLFVVITTVLIYPIYKSRDQKRHFIVWGLLAMNAGIFITLLFRFQSIDFSILPFKIGSIIEIIIFSIGLVYRQQQIELDSQQVQHELEKSKILQIQEQAESERLKELNEFKSNVYANITHEFKTPLTVILGMVDKIQEDSKVKKLIKRNSDDLLDLVDRLLDLSRAETNQMTFTYVYGDVVPYINYLFESIVSSAEEKDIDLKLDSKGGGILMEYDESVIKHIVNNLLSNAIKFTPSGGQVILRIQEQSDVEQKALIIEVTDTGIGIPHHEIGKVFDRFYRSSVSLNLGVRGSGLGLALVKELTENLSGSITIKSDQHSGTIFKVTLPILQGSLAKNQEQLISEIRVSKDLSHKGDGQLISNRPLVLLVEDNHDVMTYIELCLEDEYDLVKAHNGIEGLRLAIETIPDVIVTDLMMPLMDGIRLTSELREDKRTSHIPIIMLTAKSDQRSKIKAISTGAEVYISKPFDQEELLARLKGLIENRRKLHDYYTGEQKQSAWRHDPFITELTDYILANIGDSRLNVETLKDWSLLSRTQLHRKIKAVTNMSTTQLITSIRMDKARKLMATTDMTIAELSYAVGYSDPNYFSRKFATAYGVSPSDYKAGLLNTLET